MAIRTDYEDIKAMSDVTINLTFTGPMLEVAESVISSADTEMLSLLTLMITRRRDILRVERQDSAVLVGFMTQDEWNEERVTRLQKEANETIDRVFRDCVDDTNEELMS